MARKKRLLSLTKKAFATFADFVLILFCLEMVLLSLEFGFHHTMDWRHYVTIPAYFLCFYLIMQRLTKMNNILWEYSGGKAFIYLHLSILVSALTTFGLSVATFGYQKWELAFLAISYFVCYSIVSAFKLLILQFYIAKHQRKHITDEPIGNTNNTLIIGAGWTGTSLAKAFENDHSIFKPVCFVDDNPEKLGKRIQDLPVVGTTHNIVKIVNKYHIKKIIFAIPSCVSTEKKRIINDCISTPCSLKIVPPIQEMVDQCDQKAIQPREVRIEDLLGREPMTFDMESIKDHIRNKVVLVTGGGGSIGSELCRQIAKYEPKQLVIMDIYENNAYDIQLELVRHYPKLNLEVSICSIADYERCRILFDTFRPELVFHAAAHKHVPLMEHVPEQAIKNNVVGTWNLCELAAEFKVKRFLLISTDKAVNPTNVMGASKRCCEMVVKYHAQTCPDTVFCAVRFGNVLGSNGSVIPLFRRLISEGGPITITDKNIIRYFMTIPEAVSLVLEAGTFSKSGEIFVLDMGEPVKILDLAENMIRLMGMVPYRDIDIVFTGLRPGEKLYEELLISGEGMRKTANKKIFICQQIDVEEDAFIGNLNKLIDLAKANKPEDVIGQLHVMIPTYHNPSVD